MLDAQPPCLEVQNLVVEFPNRHGILTALNDVSLTIAPGEILGVVGESGAGKSMTGAAILGLLERPGRIAGEWHIKTTAGRRIESPEVAALAAEITAELRKEIARNAR